MMESFGLGGISAPFTQSRVLGSLEVAEMSQTIPISYRTQICDSLWSQQAGGQWDAIQHGLVLLRKEKESIEVALKRPIFRFSFVPPFLSKVVFPK